MSRDYITLDCGCIVSCDSGGGGRRGSCGKKEPECKFFEWNQEHQICDICGKCRDYCYGHKDCKIIEEIVEETNVIDNYGLELILDIHNCDPSTFNRDSITHFFEQLCESIDMERCDLHFWDDEGVSVEEQQTEPHLKGTSSIQFIKTSNITIHTLDILKRVYLNIFSCKSFDPETVRVFSRLWFGGEIVNDHLIERV